MDKAQNITLNNIDFSTAERLKGIDEYYFSQKLREINELNQQGKNIINLGVGSPDLAPHAEVIKVLQEESSKPNIHGYQSYKGLQILREAISAWYNEWYKVSLNANTEILPLIGSKEGIMHICMTYLNKGDIALVPNPGYPTYTSAVQLAGGTCLNYELTEKNDYYPDFNWLEKTDLSKVRLMWVNYPHMPTGKKPTKDLFENIIAFGKKHNILICHDNPYSFILNDEPMSLLSIEGAKEVVLELNSLSKSHNMAGWRVGMLCCAQERIDEVLKFKSNMDSGMFLPLQLAAAKALSLNKSWFNSLNDIYKKRKQKVCVLLNLLNCSYRIDQSGMFVWARIPDGFENGYSFSDFILYNSDVFITPGEIFGSAGEKYIRVSLCSPEEKIEEAASRIKLLMIKKEAQA